MVSVPFQYYDLQTGSIIFSLKLINFIEHSGEPNEKLKHHFSGEVVLRQRQQPKSNTSEFLSDDAGCDEDQEEDSIESPVQLVVDSEQVKDVFQYRLKTIYVV